MKFTDENGKEYKATGEYPSSEGHKIIIKAIEVEEKRENYFVIVDHATRDEHNLYDSGWMELTEPQATAIAKAVKFVINDIINPNGPMTNLSGAIETARDLIQKGKA